MWIVRSALADFSHRQYIGIRRNICTQYTGRPNAVGTFFLSVSTQWLLLLLGSVNKVRVLHVIRYTYSIYGFFFLSAVFFWLVVWSNRTGIVIVASAYEQIERKLCAKIQDLFHIENIHLWCRGNEQFLNRSVVSVNFGLHCGVCYWTVYMWTDSCTNLCVAVNEWLTLCFVVFYFWSGNLCYSVAVVIILTNFIQLAVFLFCFDDLHYTLRLSTRNIWIATA